MRFAYSSNPPNLPFCSSHCFPNQFCTCLDEPCTSVTWQNFSWAYTTYLLIAFCPRASSTEWWRIPVGIHLTLRHVQWSVNTQKSSLTNGRWNPKCVALSPLKRTVQGLISLYSSRGLIGISTSHLQWYSMQLAVIFFFTLPFSHSCLLWLLFS